MPDAEKQRSAEKEAEIDRKIEEIRRNNALIEERFRIVSEEAKKSGIPKSRAPQNDAHPKAGSNGKHDRVHPTSEKPSRKSNNDQKQSRGHGKANNEPKGKDNQWSREWDRGKTNVDEWKMNVPEVGDHGNSYFRVGEQGNGRGGRAPRPRRNPGYFHDDRCDAHGGSSVASDQPNDQGDGGRRGGRRSGGQQRGGKPNEKAQNDSNNNGNPQQPTEKGAPVGEKTPRQTRRQNQKHKNGPPVGNANEAGERDNGNEVKKQGKPKQNGKGSAASKDVKPQGEQKEAKKQNPKTKNAKSENKQNSQNNRQNKKHQQKENAGPLSPSKAANNGPNRTERTIKSLLDNVIDRVVMQEKKDRRKETTEATPPPPESLETTPESPESPQTEDAPKTEETPVIDEQNAENPSPLEESESAPVAPTPA